MSLWPPVKVKSVCLGISRSAWTWLGSSQLHAGAGGSLGRCSWPAPRCSDIWHGDGAGNALHQPMSQTHSQLSACALPLSIPACSGGSFPHVSAAHASTGAWAANTRRWGKTCPLPHIRGLAVLCLPLERLGCSRGAQSCCAPPVHPVRHHGETPRPCLPAAQGCNCSVPADAAVAALPSPDPGWPLGALWQRG